MQAAVWMMRLLVASNVLTRREGTALFVPVNPAADPEGRAIARRSPASTASPRPRCARRPWTAMLTETPAGLYCAAGDFHIDPWGAVPRALITHAHGDHARPGSAAYLCADAGAAARAAASGPTRRSSRCRTASR